MAHAETIMTSAPPEEILNALCGLPGVTLLEHKAETVVIDLAGELIDVEEVRNEEGSFGSLTTAIDVYGPTDDDARQRTKDLFTVLKGLGRFDIGMNTDNHDNFGPSSTIYVGDTSENSVRQLLPHHFSSEFCTMEINAYPYSIDIIENDDYKRNKDKQNDFVYWPIFIDIVNDAPVALQDTIVFTSNILKLLWSKKLPAIAECDFEEELPCSGGGKSPVMPPERF